MSDERPFTCRIEAIEPVTHDVKRLVVAKPDGYTFEPGQATEAAIDKDGWRDEGRPFTFTSRPVDPRLEFTIKIYPDHNGVTEQIGKLAVGDALRIGEAWGAIRYGGPGTFIAGGAGVTPFIAILRKLEADGELPGNQLLFSNKTAKDVILEGEFRRMLGDRAIFTLSREERDGYEHGRIDRAMIERHVQQLADTRFYLCGPPPMVEELGGLLEDLGVTTESVVVEED